MGRLIDGRGNLSVDGKRRLDAAIAAYAYEDPRVVSDLLETTDTKLKSIGEVMVEVAPKWAELRAGIEAGRTDPRVNIIQDVVEAANIIKGARENGTNLREHVDQLNAALFEDTRPSPRTLDLLEVFYGPDLKRQRKPSQIADELRYYAQEADKASAEPDMFGDNTDPSERILERITAMRAAGKQFTIDDDFNNGTVTPITEPSAPPEGFEIVPRGTQAETDAPLKSEQLFDEAPKTESQAFKRWFGESKVVDENGDPLVVYHGTVKGGFVGSTDIEAFDSDKVGDRWNADSRGFFFTNDQKIADYYSQEEGSFRREDGHGEGAVYPVYLSLQNPLIAVSYTHLTLPTIYSV